MPHNLHAASYNKDKVTLNPIAMENFHGGSSGQAFTHTSPHPHDKIPFHYDSCLHVFAASVPSSLSLTLLSPHQYSRTCQRPRNPTRIAEAEQLQQERQAHKFEHQDSHQTKHPPASLHIRVCGKERGRGAGGRRDSLCSTRPLDSCAVCRRERQRSEVKLRTSTPL